MANQTITTDTNHDSLTGRNAGENITVNDGATLTIDSWVSKTAMGIMGDLTVNRGSVIIDGRDVKEIAYSSGSGSLPAVGATVTDSGGASGKVIWLTSGTATTGVITITQQSGTFAASNTISDSGTWSATIDSVVVGLLVYYGEDQSYVISDALCSFEVRGDWYELGTGDGTDSQTFTRPWSMGRQWGCWVETGSGTGVYERWARISDSDALTNFGLDDVGNVFEQPLDTATMTFGTSTAGGVVPNGAKVRIPNVHLGTTTTGAPETEVVSTNENNYWQINANRTGKITYDTCNGSSINNGIQTGLDISISNTSTIAVDTFTNINGLNIQNSIFANDEQVEVTGGITLNISSITGLILDGVLCYKNYNSAANALRVNTSRNATVDSVKTLSAYTTGTFPTGCSFGSVSDSTINDLIVGGNGLGINKSSNLVFNRPKVYFKPAGTTAVGDNIRFSDGANNITLDSADFPGICGSRRIFDFDLCSNITIRKMGTRASPIDISDADVFIELAGSSTGIKMQRCYFSGPGNDLAIETIATTEQITFENVATSFDKRVVFLSRNTTIKGLSMGSGNLNASDGIEVDSVNAVGTNFYDLFTSATEGKIGVFFRPPISGNGVTTDSGSPQYNANGDLYLTTDGDSEVYEWQWDILGHTGFQNVAESVDGNLTANIDREYSLSTDSGDTWGSWKTVSGANLSGETISDTGFRIRFRFTADGSDDDRYINGFYIETTTTTTAQDDNQYPLEEVVLTYLGTNANSILYVFNDADDSLITTGTHSGSNTAATVGWNEDYDVVKRLRLPGYETVENTVTVTENDASIPVGQQQYSLIGATDPGLTANITITDHGASPVTWDAGDGNKDYSITIQTTLTGDSYTAAQLLNEINYSIAQSATYFSYEGYDWPEMLVQVGLNVETSRGRLFGSSGATLKGCRVITSTGVAHPSITRFQADDGTYGAPLDTGFISAPNLTAGRIQVVNETGRTASAWAATTAYSLYNKVLRSTGTGSESGIGLYFQCTTAGTSGGSEPTWDTTVGNTTADGSAVWTCRAIEFDNDTTTSGYTNSWTDHEEFDNGDTIRIRWVDSDELELEATGVAQQDGTTSFLNVPVDDEVYDSYGIDGSTVTEYSGDYPNVQVDINDPDNVFYLDRFYAWFKYNLTTADGIRNFYGGVTAVNTSNININNDVVDIFLDNTKAVSARQGDNIVLQRTDGVYPQVTVTSGGGGLGFYYTGVGYSSGSGLDPDERTKLLNLADYDPSSDTLEGSLTYQQAQRIMLAESAGKVSVSGSTVNFRDQADSKNRIIATTDTDGQRTAVTVDGT